jgi:hypothetical protein
MAWVQQETELSTMRQDDSHADPGRCGPAHDRGDDGCCEDFSRQERDRPSECRPGCYGDDRRIHLRADGYKEKAQQDVAKGPDIVLDLMAKVAFPDHHPGQKGADRRGDAGVARRERGPQGKKQNG